MHAHGASDGGGERERTGLRIIHGVDTSDAVSCRNELDARFNSTAVSSLTVQLARQINNIIVSQTYKNHAGEAPPFEVL